MKKKVSFENIRHSIDDETSKKTKHGHRVSDDELSDSEYHDQLQLPSNV